MTEKQFFKKLLLAPLIFPLVAYVIALFFQSISVVVYQWATFLVFSVIYGGIPYLVFWAIFYWWQQDKNGKQVRQFTYAAPFIFTIIFLVLLFLFVGIFRVGSLSEMVSKETFFDEVFFMAKNSFLTSAGYVLAAHIVYYIFKFSNKIKLSESGSAT